ncbi:MAG: 4Fe-4S dicluster domain-containing protein [Spirochaetaceae bacterium]|jgi:electron transport complex protein RnfC|nr:4Fe-4S dicluster domain-containing protein [Spirochaetaceae bacterium]
MKVYSFSSGGINIEDGFAPDGECSNLAFLPEQVVIPLSTEAGSRSIPVVSAGQHIEEGMLLARGQGSGSANIYSPIPGSLRKMIKWEPAPGFLSDAFVIRLEGSFKRLGKQENRYNWAEFNRFEIQSLISEYGITEMDGLGRPLIDIFSAYNAARSSFTLVVRCIFDDPWLAADYCLCKEKVDAVAEGSLVTAKAVGAEAILFAVSASGRKIGEALFNSVKQREAQARLTVSLILTGSRYPQRSDYVMENALRLYEKKEGAGKGGFLILGPATVAAVHDAVVLRTPALERYVAVGGAAVKHPMVIRSRIGARLRDIFAECGGFCVKPENIAVTGLGSPLLGRSAGLDEPILKTSSGVFAIPVKRSEAIFNKFRRLKKIHDGLPSDVCISCGECRNVCPARLDPEDLYKGIKDGKRGDDARYLRCIGCGCCEAACPSKLPLCTVIVRSRLKGDACAV